MKASTPRASHKELMSALSAQWRDTRAGGTHNAEKATMERATDKAAKYSAASMAPLTDENAPPSV
eukprot:4462806-Pleurochrysis_carterae.AAC.9